MFFGIRDDGTIRGKLFESTVRESITDLLRGRGFEIGPRKLYENGRLVDEIDLMVRRGRRVFVCECFSMWLPLNSEIGDKNTISNRVRQIDKKNRSSQLDV
jgi:hypothetical protein